MAEIKRQVTEEISREQDAEDEAEAVDDVPDAPPPPPAPAPTSSVAPSSDELLQLRQEIADLREAFDGFRSQMELPEMKDLIQLSASMGQQFSASWQMEQRVQQLSDRLDSEMARFAAQAQEFDQQRQQAIEAHQAAIAVAKSGAEMMSKLNSQAAQTVNEARAEAYDSRISSQVLSEALLEQHITGQVAPSPVLQPPPQNPYRPEPRPIDNTPPPVAVDPHEQPTTPPPPALQPGMRLPEENAALAAELAAATRERMEGTGDV